MPTRHSLFILIGIIAPFLCSAADEGVHVELSAVTLDNRIQDIKYLSEGETQSLYVFRKRRSQAFDYKGPPTLTFFRETGEVDEAGDPVRQPVGRVKIPAASGKFLLLMKQTSESPEQYAIRAVPDDWADFQPGTYRFLNLAPFDIAFKLQDTVHRIKQYDFTDVESGAREHGYYEAIMVSLPEGEKPVKIFEGHIRVSDQTRMLYIVSPREGRKGSVNFIAVSETQPASPADTAPSDGAG